MPINCSTNLAAYPLGCREISGTADLWVGAWSANTVHTYDSTGIITGGTIVPTYFNIPQRIETCEFHPGAPKASSENGTIFYEQSLNFTLHKYSATLRNIVISLGKAECSFIVQTQSGKYFLVGEENGALLQDGDVSLGKAFGDLNGANFNFLAKGEYPAREISAAYIATLTFSS